VALSEPLAKFVTVEAYVAAGGVIQRDLFDTENEGYMPDRALALTLAHTKLVGALDGVLAEGWKWVKAEVERDYAVSYGRVYPAYDDEGEGEDGNRSPGYSQEDMARAGAILRIGWDGELAIERGLVHPDDRESSQVATTVAVVKAPGALPASIVRELSAHRTAAIQAGLVENPAIALAATVYSLALPLFGSYSSHSCLGLGLKPTRTMDIVTVPDECGAHATMIAEAQHWGERLPGNPDHLFEWCLAQPQDVLLSLLAFCAASSVNAIKDKFDSDTSLRLAHADVLCRSLSLDMSGHWKPTVEGFYGRLTKATLLRIVDDAKVSLPIRMDDVKKETAARHVMQAMATTGWLPSVLRDRTVGRDEKDGVAQAA
jgi:ParB family chromosome partitioning protein